MAAKDAAKPSSLGQKDGPEKGKTGARTAGNGQLQNWRLEKFAKQKCENESERERREREIERLAAAAIRW